ncbi:MAG: hypothetical protein NTX11_00610 [Candidatus Saccharibacteria bacterium]|nr:hypothetical protein [Candidatus Saccharibacteria bacterium]
MKITQTETKLELVDSGITNLIVGVLMTVIGLIFAVAIVTGSINSNSGKPTPIWVAGILGIVCVAGIFVIMKAQKKIIVLDKSGPSSVTTTRIIGGKTEVTEISLASITSVELIVRISDNIDSDNRRRSQMQSYLSLVQNNNQKIQITNSTNSSRFSFANTGIGVSPLENEATQIATFLGVPLNKPNNEIGEMVNAIKDVFQGSPTAATPAVGTQPEQKQ